MAKKKLAKTLQLLSPENYIRQKARNLALYECLVNKDWEDGKMANIIVARVHANGNMTVGLYLVDLLCLGVKDTQYFFNMPAYEYDELVAKMEDAYGLLKIPYDLAHNIVFAGVVFAEEYGFKPHKDFNSITINILEEDTDDIDLIDIECGMEGKPCFVKGPDDSSARINQIATQLERTAGIGNFKIIDEDELDDLDDFDDDDLADVDPQLLELSYEEQKNEFLSLSKGVENDNSEADFMRLLDLTTILFPTTVDESLVDIFIDEMESDLDIEILSDAEVTDELLGVEPGSLSQDTKELFFEVYESISGNPIKTSRLLEQFQAKVGWIGSVKYLELCILHSMDSRDYPELLADAYVTFPDYPLIKLQWLSDIALSGDISNIEQYKPAVGLVFPGRTFLQEFEVLQYLLCWFHYMSVELNASRIDAFDLMLDGLDLSDQTANILASMMSMLKVTCLTKLLAE
jgi:hypothetical protein